MSRAGQLLLGDGFGMASAVRSGEITAAALVQASLDRTAATDERVNAFTYVGGERALARAAALDKLRAANPVAFGAMPLAGVPFAVKNLFDIEGIATLAGSKIERGAPPAKADAVLVQRLEAAGAVLTGALNMDEYAYGFTTENSHEGACRNPHDLSRIAGGSSGGSGATIAAGQVPLSLGSDTNGSIRVPSSLCGVFGLKPTFGRLPRTRSYPFISSLDHLGPFARTARDLALAYDAMQGPEDLRFAHDPGCAQRAVEAVSPLFASGSTNITGLRIGVLGGHFRVNADAQALNAVDAVAAALGVTSDIGPQIELPMVQAGRAAAFLITNSEGAALHLPDLRTRPDDFEPLSRDRFLAGSLIPAAWVEQAQRVRRVYAEAVARVFEKYDVLLAPSTPCAATPIGTEFMELNGAKVPLRPSIGVLTQPISCIGLPVCAVPIWSSDPMPIGVQVIAAPWREDLVLRVAAFLEQDGVAHAPVAAL
ncbi:AtzE family amidohydrolase [soil metagenome]